MIYVNKKNQNEYVKITEALKCDNDCNNDLAIIYTHKKGFLVNLRLFLIMLLLPNDIYVRSYVEFHEKFDSVKDI